MEQRVRDDGEWHLDKRVPISILVLIVIQSMTAIWWASNISTNMAAITVYMESADKENLRQWDRINQNEEGIGEIKSILLRNTAILERVEKTLEKAIDKPPTSFSNN